MLKADLLQLILNGENSGVAYSGQEASFTATDDYFRVSLPARPGDREKPGT